MEEITTGTAQVGRRWWFLDVEVHVLRDTDPTVMELVLPVGAAPPEHVHTSYDDSFLVSEGALIVRQADVTRVVGPGEWVSSPAGTPHTFRVVGPSPAHVLQVFNGRSFLDLIQELGEPAPSPGLPPPGRSPDVGTVLASFAAHDVVVTGESIPEGEAVRVGSARGNDRDQVGARARPRFA